MSGAVRIREHSAKGAAPRVAEVFADGDAPRTYGEITEGPGGLFDAPGMSGLTALQNGDLARGRGEAGR